MSRNRFRLQLNFSYPSGREAIAHVSSKESLVMTLICARVVGGKTRIEPDSRRTMRNMLGQFTFDRMMLSAIREARA